MPLQRRAYLTQGIKILEGEITGIGEDGVQQRATVPFGKMESVTIRPLGILRVMPQDTVEQRGQKVRR